MPLAKCGALQSECTFQFRVSLISKARKIEALSNRGQQSQSMNPSREIKAAEQQSLSSRSPESAASVLTDSDSYCGVFTPQ
jgi:hypothetical protein